MAQHRSDPPSLRHDGDYEEIEAAVMETARGRWFLAEFARRNRSADTDILLDAIHKLRLVMQDGQPPDGLGNLRSDLMEMATSIAQTRRDLAAMPVAAEAASGDGELDSIVATTEKATSDILGAAEQIQEIGWTLREQGVDAAACDALDAHATDIYTACSFQDLTGQRIGKVIAVLNDIEARLNALVDIWGLDDIEIKPLHASPAGASRSTGESAPPRALGPPSSQREIDRMLVGPVSAAPAPASPADEGTDSEDTDWVQPAEAEAPGEPAPADEDAGREAVTPRAAAPSSPASRDAETAGTPDAPEKKVSAAPEPAGSPQPDPDSDLDRLPQAHKTALFS